MKIEKVLWLLVVLFYGFGIPGILLFPDFFLPFSPFSLLLGACYLLFTQRSLDQKFAIGFAFTFLVTWVVEWIGVHTGLLFGTYSYGPTLGISIDGIPLIIGLNWCVMLIYSQHVAKHFFPNMNKSGLAMIAGLHMTLLDVIMEYTAPKLGFWQFENSQGLPMWYAPLHNFAGWFVVSSVLSYFTLLWSTETLDKRKVNFALVNWIFFAALSLGFLLSKA
jgi:putative membrane protein